MKATAEYMEKNFFPLPNQIFSLGLCSEEFAQLKSEAPVCNSKFQTGIYLAMVSSGNKGNSEISLAK